MVSVRLMADRPGQARIEELGREKRVEAGERASVGGGVGQVVEFLKDLLVTHRASAVPEKRKMAGQHFIIPQISQLLQMTL